MNNPFPGQVRIVAVDCIRYRVEAYKRSNGIEMRIKLSF